MIPPPIKALMNRDPEVNETFVFNNPDIYKSNKMREINARWKHYSTQLKNLRAPLRQSEVEHIQTLANKHGSLTPKTKMQIDLENEMKGKRASTGMYQGKYSRITPRFLRRRYQSLIKGYIPVISQTEGGKWHVEAAQLPSSTIKIPPVEPRHMYGYVMSCGTKVGEVDTKGAFINTPSKQYHEKKVT